VRIVSRAGAPQELGLSRDPRPLGVALRQIVVTQGRRTQIVGAEDKRLTKGFYEFEVDNGIRWTDGDAAVPAGLFAGMSGAGMLILNLGQTTQYLAEGEMRCVA
jgi:hypothetical protein